MRLFDQKIVDLLREEVGTEPIFFVGLGAFDFQLAFGNLKRVQNMQRIEFRIAGNSTAGRKARQRHQFGF
mgnify:CR=1 FL=1